MTKMPSGKWPRSKIGNGMLESALLTHGRLNPVVPLLILRDEDEEGDEEPQLLAGEDGGEEMVLLMRRGRNLLLLARLYNVLDALNETLDTHYVN